MAGKTDPKAPDVAVVDTLVDETGAPIVVPEGSPLRMTDMPEESVGATSPAGWWFYGVLALAIVIALLLVLQMLNGAPGTATQPGSPTAQPLTAPQ